MVVCAQNDYNSFLEPIFTIVLNFHSLSSSITCKNLIARNFHYCLGSHQIRKKFWSQKHQDCLQHTATVHCSSRMPRAVLLWVEAHRWPWEGAKELLMRPAGILSLFSLCQLLKGAFHHFPCIPKGTLRAFKWTQGSGILVYLSVSPIEGDACTHTRTHTQMTAV